MAEVSAKGRGGKPDCAQWALNVRPLGFYGENDSRTVKTKNPDPGEQSDKGSTERKPSRENRLESAIGAAIRLIDTGDVAGARNVLDAARR